MNVFLAKRFSFVCFHIRALITECKVKFHVLKVSLSSVLLISSVVFCKICREKSENPGINCDGDCYI